MIQELKKYQVRADGSQVAKATIYDDDTPELKISASGTLTEGDGNNANFTITSEVLIASKQFSTHQLVQIFWKVALVSKHLQLLTL